MKTKDDEYLRVKRAAAMVGIAPNTMRKGRVTGKFPEYRHSAKSSSRRLNRHTDRQNPSGRVPCGTMLEIRCQNTQTRPVVNGASSRTSTTT